MYVFTNCWYCMMDNDMLCTNIKVNNSVYIVLRFLWLRKIVSNSLGCQNIPFKSWLDIIHCLQWQPYLKLICKLAYKRESPCPRFLAMIPQLIFHPKYTPPLTPIEVLQSWDYDARAKWVATFGTFPCSRWLYDGAGVCGD